MIESIPKILCCDGYNLFHRARSGFTAGEHAVTFNFFRGLRALVQQHSPTRVYFVLEGQPKQRLNLFPDYKGNRKIEPGTKKHKDFIAFTKQKLEIIDILTRHFPVSVVQHSDFECDDVIYNLVKDSVKSIDWTVISSDSDFTQLINEFPNVSLYNPIAKAYTPRTPFNYVDWKALRGDPSDNIDGVTGIGDKRALDLVTHPEKLVEAMLDQDKNRVFELNKKLIGFERWSEEQATQMTSSKPIRDWDAVKTIFEAFAFKSIVKEPTWSKFVDTFDKLFTL